MQAQSDKRKKGLETAQQYYQFLQDTEEEDRWVGERIETVRSSSLGKDLNAALVMLKKHEVSHLSWNGYRWSKLSFFDWVSFFSFDCETSRLVDITGVDVSVTTERTKIKTNNNKKEEKKETNKHMKGVEKKSKNLSDCTWLGQNVRGVGGNFIKIWVIISF